MDSKISRLDFLSQLWEDRDFFKDEVSKIVDTCMF